MVLTLTLIFGLIACVMFALVMFGLAGQGRISFLGAGLLSLTIALIVSGVLR